MDVWALLSTLQAYGGSIVGWSWDQVGWVVRLGMTVIFDFLTQWITLSGLWEVGLGLFGGLWKLFGTFVDPAVITEWQTHVTWWGTTGLHLANVLAWGVDLVVPICIFGAVCGTCIDLYFLSLIIKIVIAVKSWFWAGGA